MAGRSRRTNDLSFKDDHKHTLYREYLHIIRRFRPAVFVMENVKGMLSAQHGGGRIFEAIRADLSEPAADLGYDVRSFVVAGAGPDLEPTDFVIRSEKYGVPQSRHRVILLGIRSDVTPSGVPVLHESPQMTVRDAIGDLPRIRSGISPRSQDSTRIWERSLLTARAHAGVIGSNRSIPPLGRERQSRYRPREAKNDLERWIRADAPAGISLHESRYHMPADLERYAYLAYRAAKGEFPRVNDLPKALRPQHRNAGRDDTPFVDRFRVQRWNAPSSTVVSHMAKDGHYYIHPDPEQMRSLTVREAARLQTFPDNYHFIGSRTQQYHQVGNAVPPLLARQLGQVVAAVLGIQPTTG
jgi:DNA (cytosine-5)-methyltransferase 1